MNEGKDDFILCKQSSIINAKTVNHLRCVSRCVLLWTVRRKGVILLYGVSGGLCGMLLLYGNLNEKEASVIENLFGGAGSEPAPRSWFFLSHPL